MHARTHTQHTQHAHLNELAEKVGAVVERLCAGSQGPPDSTLEQRAPEAYAAHTLNVRHLGGNMVP